MATSIPPHNAAELCDAALHLITKPGATSEQLMQFVPGPGFPDRRHHRRHAVRHGRDLPHRPRLVPRARALGEGGTGRGTWQIVVTEIPYPVPKSRLIEKIAELLQDKKLPLLADVRDESAEDIRVVLEPRAQRSIRSS